jgi:formyltetrahydrofolate synthetase
MTEMTSDENALVRDQALHALGGTRLCSAIEFALARCELTSLVQLNMVADGSPSHLEERIVEVVERLYNDPDINVKKKARRMLNSYRRTGKWNVL